MIDSKVSPLFHNKIEVFAERREAVLKSGLNVFNVLDFGLNLFLFVQHDVTQYSQLNLTTQQPARRPRRVEKVVGMGPSGSTTWLTEGRRQHKHIKIQMRKGKLTTILTEPRLSVEVCAVSELPYKSAII